MEWKPALTYQEHVYNITCEPSSRNIIISPNYRRVEVLPPRASIGDCVNEIPNCLFDPRGRVFMHQ